MSLGLKAHLKFTLMIEIFPTRHLGLSRASGIDGLGTQLFAIVCLAAKYGGVARPAQFRV